MLPRSTEIQPYVASIRPSLLPHAHQLQQNLGLRLLRPIRMPRDGEKIPQVPGPPHRASAPAERDTESRMAPNSPRKEIQSPRTTHHGTCSGRKKLPKCRIRKMPLKFCRIHLRVVLSLPAKESAQKSKCGVVQNSPSAESGKLEKKIYQTLSDASEILHIPSAHRT